MPVVPPLGPMPTRLPARSATDSGPESRSAMNWNGVSYIRKTAASASARRRRVMVMRVIAMAPSERRRPGRAGGLDLVLDHDLLRRVGLGVGLAVEVPAHPLDVERALPAGDDDGGDAVADQVGERARLRHEPVDAQG